ncbi:MAG: YraN family protein [Roseomonas sp.]|nr:YraN family protein [Roseomonas sp.]
MKRETPPSHRLLRGRSDYAAGQDAEALAAAALTAEGWSILAQRCRTEAGEIDLIAEREGLLAFIEVKALPCLA